MMPDLPSTRRSKIYQKNESRTVVKWGCSKIQIDSNKPITKNNQILKKKKKKKVLHSWDALYLSVPSSVCGAPKARIGIIIHKLNYLFVNNFSKSGELAKCAR
jgi:hypothetical protein